MSAETAKKTRRLKIGVICQENGLAVWQKLALERISADHEIFTMVCPEPPRSPRKGKHAAYYALNIVTIRNRMTRQVPFPATIHVVERFDFDAEYEGAWAVLPANMLAWIQTQDLDAVVKFGLGLMRIPDPQTLSVPILSYHHGDPRQFRGRPAGFYELCKNERFVGQVVQVLSNKLDQGTVLAFAVSRAIPHSYKGTLVEAFRLSPHLLSKALAVLAVGGSLQFDPAGPNYKLPTNGAVARFVLMRIIHLFARVGYGAFVEKRWQVSTFKLGSAVGLRSAIEEAAGRPADWSTVPQLPGFSFYADPFFASDADLLVEALNARTGKGELVQIGPAGQQVIEGFSGHVSYPAPVEEGGRTYVCPEISNWSKPGIYEILGAEAKRVRDLDIDAAHLLDPTLFKHGNRFYLFANTTEDGTSVLHLWSAPELFARFEKHPSSPIRVSVRGSRMAGQICSESGTLYRLGQDFREVYGDGVLAFQILELSEHAYQEEQVSELAFAGVRGPHTLNIRGNTLVFDWFYERLSPMAGVRRLMNRL